MKLIHKLRSLFRRRQFEREMTEEMRLHLELQTEKNIAAGMDVEEAQYAAKRQFGGIEQIKERCRSQRGWTWLEDGARDLKYSIRALLRDPGFAVTAVLTLALGIGMNAALFIVYDVVVLRTLPSRAPERLVEIRAQNEQTPGGADPRFSYPDYVDVRSATHAFSDVVALMDARVQLDGGPTAMPTATDELSSNAVTLESVSGNYFSALGGEIGLGRDFLPEESGKPGSQEVMILSHHFWERHLNKNPDVLGRTLAFVDPQSAQRKVYTIVGVAAPGFVGTSAAPPAGWIPLTSRVGGLEDRKIRGLFLIGRMLDGVSLPNAKADLDLIMRRLASSYPEERRASSVRLWPAMRITNVGLSSQFFMMMSPVLLGFFMVLMIACLNVANLLLARGVTRQHEIGVRLTLGASRGRLVRQLLVENVLLCAMGAALGLLFAVWILNGLRPVVSGLLEGQPAAQLVIDGLKFGLDGRVVGYTAFLMMVSGATAGIAPALHASRRDLFSAIRNEGSAFGRRLSQSRLRSVLIVAQIAVCLALLSVAGIFVGDLSKARGGGIGFNADRVFFAQFGERFGADATAGAAAVVREAIQRLAQAPAVEAAATAEQIPLSKPGDNLRHVLVKTPGVADATAPQLIGYNRVSPDFFATLQIGLKQGRTFTTHEWNTDAAVAVLTETAANALWPGQNPIGKTIWVNASIFSPASQTRRGGANENVYRDCEIVGVVRDFRNNWNEFEDGPAVFFPMAAQRVPRSVLFRVRSESGGTLSTIVKEASAMGIPLQVEAPLATMISRGILAYRVFAWVSGVLAALALVLATVGIYGVMSFSVNQRVKEIGVRVALGADVKAVVGLFVRRGMGLVAIGMTAGLIGGFGFTRLVARIFPWAALGDPNFRVLVFGSVVALLGSAGLLACWLPARRAATVDPIVALRFE